MLSIIENCFRYVATSSKSWSSCSLAPFVPKQERVPFGKRLLHLDLDGVIRSARWITSLAILGAVFLLDAHSARLGWLAVGSVMLYVGSFAISLGPTSG